MSRTDTDRLDFLTENYCVVTVARNDDGTVAIDLVHPDNGVQRIYAPDFRAAVDVAIDALRYAELTAIGQTTDPSSPPPPRYYEEPYEGTL